MVKQFREHEIYINERLNNCKSDEDRNRLNRYHIEQLCNFQHERLVHLLVTLFFGLFALVTFLFIAVYQILTLLPLGILFLVLLVPYVIHYYKLENGIHKLYKFSRQLNGY